MTPARHDGSARPPDDVLDDPIWTALTGPQAELAVRRPRAVRYPVDVAPFAAVSDTADPEAWNDLAAIAGPGGMVALAGTLRPPPPPWRVERRLEAVQMVDDLVGDEPWSDPGVAPLDVADLPDMLDLVRTTDPGPFEPRTITLGGFVGVRAEGRLVAMAGRRMRPPGWVEVTAVCTDPAYRGRGLGRRVLAAVVGSIHAEGHRAFLHVLAANPAVDLYRTAGFVVRREITITVAQAPLRP